MRRWSSSIDDLTNVALFSVVSRGFGGADAARFATMGLVNVEPTVVSPPPVSLFVGDPKVETLAGLIARLAAFYKTPMKEGAEAEVLALVGFAGRRGASLGEYIDGKVPAVDQEAQDARASLESRSPLESELIDFLAPQYDAIVHGRPLESLEWPVYALLRPEFPDRLTIAPIDLTGPARFIYFGPYFALPAGAWRADVSLEVRDCYSDNRIAVDVCAAAEPLAVVHAKLPAHGVYGCKIEFEIEEPVETGRNSHAVADWGDRRRHTLARHRASPPEFARRGGRGGGGLGRGWLSGADEPLSSARAGISKTSRARRWNAPLLSWNDQFACISFHFLFRIEHFQWVAPDFRQAPSPCGLPAPASPSRSPRSGRLEGRWRRISCRACVAGATISIEQSNLVYL